MGTSKPKSAEECRAKAQECREAANTSTRIEYRIMLEHMAATWEEIAVDVSMQRADSSYAT